MTLTFALEGYSHISFHVINYVTIVQYSAPLILKFKVTFSDTEPEIRNKNFKFYKIVQANY